MGIARTQFPFKSQQKVNENEPMETIIPLCIFN